MREDGVGRGQSRMKVDQTPSFWCVVPAAAVKASRVEKERLVLQLLRESYHWRGNGPNSMLPSERKNSATYFQDVKFKEYLKGSKK